MPKLSVFVTTFNNERTLGACLRSVAWADEIVVLDSFSTDRTVELAEQHRCAVYQHSFMGYGKQKQLALERTTHDWVLLLDADEMLSPGCQAEVQALLAGEPSARGYEIRRQEQVFWRMANPGVRMNYYLRLFDKRNAYISDVPIHAAPRVDGPIARLRTIFYHFGEPDLHTKVTKINAYSTGLVRSQRRPSRPALPLIMLVYPPWFFIRSYFFKRGFLNGWAGLIASATVAFYAFLRYAKAYERAQFDRHGAALMPPGAPPLPDSPRAEPSSSNETLPTRSRPA
jgi:glycosyltransferase involved in cell wall biosynthesis